jgi:uncharacterized membrane protein
MVRVSKCFQELRSGLLIAKVRENRGEITTVTKSPDDMNGHKTERRIIMAELIVVGFKKDMYRASEVLNELMRLDDDWVVDLHDAVAVYRDYEGKLRVDQSYQMTTGEGAGWGALWGLMIGSILAIPFTAGASAAAAGAAVATGAISGTAIGAGIGAVDASSWKDAFGIPDDFRPAGWGIGPTGRLGNLRNPPPGQSRCRRRLVPRLRRDHTAHDLEP